MSIYPDGHAIVSTLAVNSIMMHSGSSITPSITLDWLVLDDDDGDLGTGTPHCSEIMAGFAMHNMEVDGYDCPNPALTITYPSGRPSLLDPNGGTVVPIIVSDGTSVPVEDSGLLHWSDSFLGWVEVPLVHLGGTDYSAVFPAFDCGASVDWYISFEPLEGDTVLSPSAAPDTTWSAIAYSGTNLIFDDNFQLVQVQETGLVWFLRRVVTDVILARTLMVLVDVTSPAIPVMKTSIMEQQFCIHQSWMQAKHLFLVTTVGTAMV